jgi:hypothetical protein
VVTLAILELACLSQLNLSGALSITILAFAPAKELLNPTL